MFVSMKIVDIITFLVDNKIGFEIRTYAEIEFEGVMTYGGFILEVYYDEFWRRKSGTFFRFELSKITDSGIDPDPLDLIFESIKNRFYNKHE
jgi:hypothetical protein